MESNTKEVYFNEYCKSCKHSGKSEDSDICDECLGEAYMYDSHKPLKYEEPDVVS